MIGAGLRGLGAQHFDIRMNTGGGYVTRIVERPGCWMEAQALQALSADLRSIASRTLKAGELTYGVFSGDAERMKHSVITVVARRDTGKPVAFNALALMDLDLGGKRQEVLHLGLVMVDPDERSQGLSWILYGLTCILLFVRNQLRPLWVSNVTQVPAVVGMVSETFSGVYPGPHDGAKRTLRHVLLARQIMARHRHVFGVGEDAGFDESRFVITNAYTGGSDDLKKTFEEAPKHRQAEYNDFCARELDYGRGDDVLQLGQMDLAAARAYLTGAVPRGSLAGLALAGGLVVLQRLALPLIHWSDTRRQWSILRPWKP